MDFIQRTVELPRTNVEQGGRPFAYIIAKDGAILAEVNRVAQSPDPTPAAPRGHCGLRAVEGIECRSSQTAVIAPRRFIH